MFEIDNTLSFNADKLVDGNEYDYVTRTSLNQGILQNTGFINEENINKAGTWSLGLLQMDFFYRQKPWYAGQFVRKITPKFELTPSAILFFSAILNKQKKKLLSVLVRYVDETFKTSIIKLPLDKTGKINFSFMEKFIAELEAQRIAELEAYLSVTGLKNYELTEEERQALEEYDSLEFEEYKVVDIFTVKNTGNILSRDITPNSGTIPYLCASTDNNAISSYISYDEKYKNNGHCVFIGGKTFVVTYQEQDFFSNDSHNLALHLKDEDKRSKLNYLYLAVCINKSLGHKYSWGNSISNKKIQKDMIALPNTQEFNYKKMELLISAIQKLVIKDVVLYADRKINATKAIINQ